MMPLYFAALPTPTGGENLTGFPILLGGGWGLFIYK
jgi:hypothetical protein